MKSTYFILGNSTHKEGNITNIYNQEISRLYGIPKATVSNKDSKFTSIFWKGLFKEFEINLNFSIAFHPQADG